MNGTGTAFISGTTGFVGANLARFLLDKGYEIRALVRPGSDRGNLPKDRRFRMIEGDLSNAASVLRAVRGCDEVYHVAADYRFWAKDPRELYESNVLGTDHVLCAAGETGARRIVHTSTVGTIGLQGQPSPCNEHSHRYAGQFTSHYKRSKLEAEEIALKYARQGLPIVIVNPSTPIGPWDCKPTPTGKIIVDFVNGRMPAYVDTGLNFIHVRDVAEGHWLAAQKGRIGERYILGGKNLTMREFLEMTAVQCRKLALHGAPKKAPSFRIPYWLAWTTGWLSTGFSNTISKTPPAVPLEAVQMAKNYMFFDSSKAVHELGLPQTPLETAVEEAVAWFFQRRFFEISHEPSNSKRMH